MNQHRWQQIERLYHEAQARPVAQRAAFLAEACVGDAALRREVEGLLESPATAEGFLDGGAMAVAAAGLGASGLRPGQRLGVYAVGERIGAGGMGEVYRARDTRLGRDVAIKILPPIFTADRDRLARFEREARVLASLNHPNIGAIYGLEEADGVRALVLELVDGETLNERIRRPEGLRLPGTGSGRPSGLPIAETLTIAAQIADALDAAHQKGIVHRDLKPANIKITPNGTVKVLDFGLAKVMVAESGAANAVPTMTIGGTREGTIVGTAAYMSPEQARGQVVDKRTDIWAFGCVLYEMLTGHSAFAAHTVSDTIAAVLEREPDWNALPDGTPESVRRLLRRCVRKDVEQRLRDIGDVSFELEDVRGASSESAPPRATYSRWVVSATVLTIIVAIAVTLLRPDEGPATPAIRTSLVLPMDQSLDAGQTAAPLAVSPDGRRVVYAAAAGGRTRLFLRSLDAFETRELSGTDGATYPFFSPDGAWVAFFADNQLKRVAIDGGAAVPVCDVPLLGRGAAWARDDTIVFSTAHAGLMRVSAAGGSPEPITARDQGSVQQIYSWPHFLPDGRRLIATVLGPNGDSNLAVFSPDTEQWRVIAPGSQAQYQSSGHLLYHASHVREGQINAVQFDVRNAEFTGPPIPVVEGVFRAANAGAAFFAASQTGTLVFAPGGFSRRLVQVDRQGRRTPVSNSRLGFRFPRYSPDGRQIAVAIDPRPSQIWVYDIERGTRTPLAADRSSITPLWTLDGRRVAFSCCGGIWWRSADGGRPAERLLATDNSANPTAWSPDGAFLVFQQDTPATQYDIRLAAVAGGAPRGLVVSAAREIGGRISPNGRWLAYYSNESGRNEVYVRSFPNTETQRSTVSIDGGQSPMWSPDGRELLYMSGTSMMVVPVSIAGDSFVAGRPEVLFDGPYDTSQDINVDISPDGNHFVMVEADPDASPMRLNVILDWAQKLIEGAPQK